MAKGKDMLGAVIDEFEVELNGKPCSVVLRYVQPSDLDEMLVFANGLVRESRFLQINKRITRDEEQEYLTRAVENVKARKRAHIVAEVKGKIIGAAHVDCGTGACSHVGTFGIALRERVANRGIGSRFMQAVEEEARKLGIELMKLSVYDNNARARHVYTKLGYQPLGVLPKARRNKDGTYQDEVMMFKPLV